MENATEKFGIIAKSSLRNQSIVKCSGRTVKEVEHICEKLSARDESVPAGGGKILSPQVSQFDSFQDAFDILVRDTIPAGIL